MTLLPDETEAGPDIRHRRTGEWLYLVGGRGITVVNGQRVELREGTRVLSANQFGTTRSIRPLILAPRERHRQGTGVELS
jgi:hypothetical protein